MALRAWRTERGRLLVQCDACSSRGHSAAAATTMIVDPKNAATHAAAQDAAQKLRLEMDGGLRAVTQLFKAKRLTREAAQLQVRELSAKHSAKVAALLESVPGLDEGAVEKISKCPWCGAEGDATVEPLPELTSEPAEWSARA